MYVDHFVQTIHLNAPKGVNDYCQRYVEKCIHPVLSKMFKRDKDNQDAFQHWTPEIWQKIHQDMEQNVCTVQNIKERCQWRNNRLLNLANHKRDQDKKEQNL